MILSDIKGYESFYIADSNLICFRCHSMYDNVDEIKVGFYMKKEEYSVVKFAKFPVDTPVKLWE